MFTLYPVLQACSVDISVFPIPVSLEQFPMGTTLTPPVSHALRWPFLGIVRLHLLNEPISYLFFTVHQQCEQLLFQSMHILYHSGLASYWNSKMYFDFFLCGWYTWHILKLWVKKILFQNVSSAQPMRSFINAKKLTILTGSIGFCWVLNIVFKK